MAETREETFRGTCTPEQKREWERAARQARRSLADWIRVTLDDAIRVAREQEQAAKAAAKGKKKFVGKDYPFAK